MRVAVVGGGAVGLAAARHLADSGAEVVLYEREGIASGSTGRAAGICYDAFAEDLDAEIGAQSLHHFRELGVLTECPYVWLAREGDDANADAIREQVPRMQAHARNVDLVDPAALADRYPQLRTDDVAVAAIAHEAGHVDPGEYAALVADELDSDAAVDVRTDAPVSLGGPTTVDSPTGTESFDAVLVAAGPATKTIVADVGVSLALKAYRVQALVTDPLHATLPMAYDATQHVYWRPRDGGLFVGDGAHPVDPNDWNREADDSFLESALERLHTATALAPEIDRSWAGLCTATPDRDPLLGEVADDLYVATGWHGHGFMRSPAMGERVAAQMLGDGDDSVAHYDPGRFDGDEEFDVIEGMTLEEE
jgi:sarcosine oxidase subunit beta